MYSFFSGSNCEGQILCSLPVKADDTPTRVCESYIILTGFFLTGVSRIYFWFVKSCVVADCRIREILCLLNRDLLGMLFKTAYFFIIIRFHPVFWVEREGHLYWSKQFREGKREEKCPNAETDIRLFRGRDCSSKQQQQQLYDCM